MGGMERRMKYLNEQGLSHFTGKIQKELQQINTKIDNFHPADPSSWKGIQTLVRIGSIGDYLSIGDQLVCNHTTFGSMIWDVIGIDHDIPTDKTKTHSLTLQCHNLIPGQIFNAQQATYYAETELKAGTYWIQLPEGYDTEYGGGQKACFYLNSALPAGGQILFDWKKDTQASLASVRTYKTPDSSTQSSIIEVELEQHGTQLTPINQMDFCRYGSGAWKNSALRKYLNSNESNMEWWYASHNYDRTPTITAMGFLSGLDADFVSVLGTVKKSTYNYETGTTESLDELMFLPSLGEVYTGTTAGTEDGTPYAYYKGDSQQPTTEQLSVRTKTYNGQASSWWLRTGTEALTSVTSVGTAGEILSNQANDRLYIAPICCIV